MDKCKGCGGTHVPIDPEKVQKIVNTLDQFRLDAQIDELIMMTATAIISHGLQVKHKMRVDLSPVDETIH